MLTATYQKPQKSLKRWYYPPSHCLNVNAMLSNITFFNDFCGFWSVAINTMDKLQFLVLISFYRRVGWVEGSFLDSFIRFNRTPTWQTDRHTQTHTETQGHGYSIFPLNELTAMFSENKTSTTTSNRSGSRWIHRSTMKCTKLTDFMLKCLVCLISHGHVTPVSHQRCKRRQWQLVQ